MTFSVSRTILIGFLIWATSLVGNSYQEVSNDPNDVKFYLYSKSGGVEIKDDLVYNDPTSIRDSAYDARKSLIILVHGFAQNESSIFPQVVKDAYLNNGFADTANVITVDWGLLGTPVPEAALPWNVDLVNSTLNSALILANYSAAAANVPVVGQRVSDFTTMLRSNNYLANFDNTHLVGMSMGAHVVGYVGANLKSTTGLVVARITGLEPAGPSYQGAAIANRLDPTDAAYVDITHTNQGEFGYLGACGKADYYINLGGPLQPGCNIPQNVAESFCAHGKAIYDFADSIADSTLKGRQCLFLGLFCTYTTYGEYSPSSASGNYYVSLP